MPSPLLILLGPILLRQGARLRRTLPRVPEPPGDRTGTVGSGPPLRLLVVGDSSAAGVGAAHQDEALLGQTLKGLVPGWTVTFRLVAKTGATTAGTLKALSKTDPAPFDLALQVLGVNDLTAGRSPSAWQAEQAALEAVLRERWGVRHLVLSGMPPVGRFPAIPHPLRWVLGRGAKRYDRALQDRAAASPHVSYVDVGTSDEVSAADMSGDGFHPGPAIYRVWGRRAAEATGEAARALGLGDGA